MTKNFQSYQGAGGWRNGPIPERLSNRCEQALYTTIDPTSIHLYISRHIFVDWSRKHLLSPTVLDDGIEATAVSMPWWPLKISNMWGAHWTINWNLGRDYNRKRQCSNLSLLHLISYFVEYQRPKNLPVEQAVTSCLILPLLWGCLLLFSFSHRSKSMSHL